MRTKDYVRNNRDPHRNLHLARLEQRVRSIDMNQTDEMTKMNNLRIGKGSVLNQVLRQCNFRKGGVQRQNFNYALSKQRAMQSMRDEIKNYTNLSSI